MTASRTDGGVAFAHAQDLVRTIPNAPLVETGAASHFYWLGPTRSTVLHAIHACIGER